MIKSWWTDLDIREQWIVQIGVISLLAILSYAYLWEPMQKHHKQLQKKVATLEKDLTWMRSVQYQFSPETTNKGSLLAAVQTVMRQQNLQKNIKKMQPLQDNQLKIVMRNIDFTKFMIALTQLLEQQIIVKQITLSKQSQGAVDAKLTVKYAL